MEQKEQLRDTMKKKNALLQGDENKAAQQRAQNKQTARERVASLYDGGSFVETQALLQGAGVVTGYGLVEGRPVYVVAQDITVQGAAMSRLQAEKIVSLLGLAKKTGAPVVFFADSEGFKVQEGAQALAAYGQVFAALSRLSGVCPVVTVVSGPCMGVATHFVTLADIAIAVEKTALVMPVSPLVMNATAGTALKDEELGGADVLVNQGVAALKAADDKQAISLAQKVLAMLPSSNCEGAPVYDGDDLNRLLTRDATDGLALAMDVADQGTAVELFAGYGVGCHTLLAQVGGRPCGIVAGQPQQDGGRLDAAACRKIARLVRLCDCYRLPVISLVMTSGLAVPCKKRQGELLRASAQMLYAYAEATTPKLAVLAGDAVGAAYVAMGGKAMADLSFAWPNSMVAPLTKEAAVQTFDGQRLKEEERAELEKEYARSADGLAIASEGLVDDVIDPAETRKHLIAGLELLYTKQDEAPAREHGNMPL